MKSLSLNQPHAIVMVGIPGSGKTFFAEKFSETFRAPYVNVDAIEQYSRGPQEAKYLGYTQIQELLKTDRSIIVEGLAITRTERTALTRELKKKGYNTLFVWVQVDNETAKTRFKKQRDAKEDDFLKAMKRFSPPHPSENTIVISGKHTYATQAKAVLKKLSAPRSVTPTRSIAPPRKMIDIQRSK